jgi:hypothetical protein
MIHRHRFYLIRGEKEIEVATSASDSNRVPEFGLCACEIDCGVHVSV